MKRSRITQAVLALSLAASAVTLAAPAAHACTGCPISAFSTVTAQNSLQVSGTYTPLVGNFGGNSNSDIFWYAPGSTPDYLWIGTANRGVFTKLSKPVSGTYTPLVGNFGGDGYDDILWYGPGSVSDSLWTSVDTPALFASSPLNINGVYQPLALSNSLPDRSGLPAVASAITPRGTRAFSSVNKGSIIWYRPGPASDLYWYFNEDGTHGTASIDIAGSPQLVPLNANSDRFQDFMAYSPGSGPDALYRNDTGAFPKSSLSVNGTYQPMVVGDGWLDDILWFRPGSGTDYYWRNDGSGLGAWNNAGTQPVGGTGPVVGIYKNGAYVYDANGPDTVFGAGNVDESSTRDVGPGAKPVSGDFDGDGAIDVFFYIPGSGTDMVGYGW